MVGFIIILTSLFLGQCLASFLRLPIPGSIYGLIILLIWLVIDSRQLAQVKLAGDILLRNIAVFIIPPGVAIVSAFSVVKLEAWLLLASLTASTLVSFVVCIQIARLVQTISRP